MRQLWVSPPLVGDPELLILDEPANGLDRKGVRWLGLPRAFAAQGKTVFVSESPASEVAQTVDQVVIINQGAVVEAGLADLTARLAGTVAVEAASPTP